MFNAHSCNDKDLVPFCDTPVMMPDHIRRELGRQSLSMQEFILEHTLLGTVVTSLVHIWALYSIASGTINLMIRLKAICSERHQGATNCSFCHIILTLFSSLDQSFNPLNLIRSQLKHKVSDQGIIISNLQEQMKDSATSINQLKTRIRELEIAEERQNIKERRISRRQMEENAYEYIGKPTGRLLPSSMPQTNYLDMTSKRLKSIERSLDYLSLEQRQNNISHYDVPKKTVITAADIHHHTPDISKRSPRIPESKSLQKLTRINLVDISNSSEEEN